MRPETFIDVLQRRLGDPIGISYRLRQSPMRKTWCIEQRVGNANPEGPEDRYHDDAIRAADGYSLVAEIYPSSKFKCPGCGFFIELAPLKFKEYQCSYCYSRGEKNLFFLAYYPFCDKLIEHLERTSPKRNHLWMKEQSVKNAQVWASRRRAKMNDIEAILKEHASGVVGVASTTDVRPW